VLPKVSKVRNQTVTFLVDGINLQDIRTTSMKLAMAAHQMNNIMSRSFKLMWPAFIVLLLTLLISAFFTKFVFVTGVESFWKILLRFFRLTIILALPILFLPYVSIVMRYLLNRGNYCLVRMREERNNEFNRWQGWLIRPLQCIGLSMLIASKFITVLQIYTGDTISTVAVLPPLHFSLWRFLSITAIAMTTSLLLSFLWTLDDMGIGYSNTKTGEVRMIGRYIGMLLPIVFGVYGIFNLFEIHERLLAVQYILQMIIVLYPPFVVMTVLHFLYIEKHENILLEKLKTESVDVYKYPKGRLTK
jgi:hypothetical protein